ncbi:hypothetical protein SAMN05428947_114169 [Mucilaginibacter sp. OK283]|jgi:hypothetical protein|nr:hypothetical protein SAMN05428947_114169 [Mucilaginibacter sp. OK283]
MMERLGLSSIKISDPNRRCVHKSCGKISVFRIDVPNYIIFWKNNLDFQILSVAFTLSI